MDAEDQRQVSGLAETYAKLLAFRPLKRSEEVARLIVRDMIASGRPTGAVLAGETEMLDNYQVSRESLREALRLLETQGLVSIRRGRGGGALVGSVDPTNLGRLSTAYFQVAGATYEDLFDAWIFAESALAEAAAQNPDLEARRFAMNPYLEVPPDSADDVDPVLEGILFHASVASLARNPVLRLMLHSIASVVAPHLIEHLGVKVVPHDSSDDHAEIARAIRGGHVLRSKELAGTHTRRLVAAYRVELGQRMNQLIDWR